MIFTIYLNYQMFLKTYKIYYILINDMLSAKLYTKLFASKEIPYYIFRSSMIFAILFGIIFQDGIKESISSLISIHEYRV